jgi:hypothetical protein
LIINYLARKRSITPCMSLNIHRSRTFPPWNVKIGARTTTHAARRSDAKQFPPMAQKRSSPVTQFPSSTTYASAQHFGSDLSSVTYSTILASASQRSSASSV